MAQRRPVAGNETLFGIIGFVLGACIMGGLAWLMLGSSSTATTTFHALRESDLTGGTSYQYVDPLIAVSSGEMQSPQYAALSKSVGDYLTQQNQRGVTVSVNFRDMRASQGFGYNPDQVYSPASLYKVPLMLSYYKIAEQDPSVLEARLTYTGQSDEDATENIKSNVQLVPGQSYTVEELIEHMIKYSDNNALVLLKDHLDATHPSALADTLSSLGAPYGGSTDFLKVGTYSIFFRALYNATYLNAEYSNKALALLTETDFAQGIEAGVPNNVAVAQKFGDSDHVSAQGSPDGYELHDCGIVYYPDHPYLLCIMSKGPSIEALEQAIAGVSKLVYQDLEHRYAQ